jgi:CRP/FNR family cyclic AMP-dependent transcriptional regulator
VSTYAKRLLHGIKFSDSRILSVIPHMSINSFDPGDVIWSKGGNVYSWNCVMTGYVVAGVPLESGGRLPVHIYGHHAWFGEQPLLGKQTSDLEYSCLTSVDVIGIKRKIFDEGLFSEPDFMRFLLDLVSLRNRQTSEMLMLMRLGCSSLRVMMTLAQFAEALNSNVDGEGSEDVVDIPISQDQIANLCGVSRTLFSEYIQQLSKAGFLKVRYGAIELKSVKAWKNFAHKQRAKERLSNRHSIDALLGDMALPLP